MLIVGESLNSAIPKVGQAILNHDEAFVSDLARSQVEAGAEMLDVAAGMSGGNEPGDLAWMVRVVQKAVKVPLMIDTTGPGALEKALEIHQGKPIINSISGERKRLENLIPVVTRLSCGVVVLCMDDEGIPKTADKRLQIAHRVVNELIRKGMKPDDLYVDYLIMTVGADWQTAAISLETLSLIRKELPEVHTICGLSNVSFGLPAKSLLNAAFLSMLLGAGMDTFLINVRDKHVMASLRAAAVLVGKDPYCASFLKAYRAGRLKVD